MYTNWIFPSFSFCGNPLAVFYSIRGPCGSNQLNLRMAKAATAATTAAVGEQRCLGVAHSVGVQGITLLHDISSSILLPYGHTHVYSSFTFIHHQMRDSRFRNVEASRGVPLARSWLYLRTFVTAAGPAVALHTGLNPCYIPFSVTLARCLWHATKWKCRHDCRYKPQHIAFRKYCTDEWQHFFSPLRGWVERDKVFQRKMFNYQRERKI